MKTLYATKALEVKDRTPLSSSTRVKVCMHLLGTARTDFRVMRDAIALVEAGFEVLIVDIDNDRTRTVEEVIDNVRLRHLRVPGWYAPTRFKLWFLVKMVQAIVSGAFALVRTNADIYHAHVEWALPATYIAARLRRKPIIFDAPELTLTDPRYTRWRSLNALVTWILAHVVPTCEGVISASPLYARDIQKRYRAPKVTLIRNVPKYRAIPKSNRLQQYLDLDAEVHIALYQGNLQPNRGLDMLVRAAPYLDTNTVIVMMGNDYRGTQTHLEALIASEGVANRVKIIPAAPYEELLDWTASADIGLTVLPPSYSLSIQLCLPNKLFEYLMAGLPVLSSPLDAVAEIIQSYDVGLVLPSLAPEGIGAAINTILADDTSRARMCRNALLVAQREFHWEKERQQLIGLYLTILGSRRTK